MIFKENAATRG